MNVRDELLERIKKPAIAVLHATPRGEAAILRVYLKGEEHAEQAAFLDPATRSAPGWLEKWMANHRADEARHAAMLRARIRELTGNFAARGGLDPLSRWKLRGLERLARSYASRFRAGLLVPLFAIAWRMEAMGVRVFERHVAVLERRGKPTPTLPMLKRILRDERGHVAACQHALRRLVTAPEWNDLQSLVFKIDQLERAFGVLGAVLLLTLGVALWLAQPFASSTSPSPTPAGT